MDQGRSDEVPSSWQTHDQSSRSLGKQRLVEPADIDPSSESMSSTPPVTSAKPSRKRRKQFKYMLAHARSHTALPQHHVAPHHPIAEQQISRQESRKKVKKACIFCKRSHMPCEEARPCQRCVKRGISDLCRDAESATGGNGKANIAKNNAIRRQHELMESEPSSSSSAPSVDMVVGASARNPEFAPMMPISHLLSPVDPSYVKPIQRHRPMPDSMRPPLPHHPRQSFSSSALSEQAVAWDRNLDLPSQHKMMQMLEAGPSRTDLHDIFGDKPTSLLIAPSMVGLPVGDPLLRPSSTGSRPNEAHGGLVRLPPDPQRSHNSVSPHPHDGASEGVSGYSYTYGFSKLARWMRTRYSRQSRESVDRTLATLRSRLLAISLSLPDSELVEAEESFARLVHHYQANVLECVPIPMFVTRRTGEIYAANGSMAKLMQLPKSLFEGGQISHYQTVTEADAVELFQLYTDECMGNLRNPPSRVATLEVDRSLLLYNKPGFDPQTGELSEEAANLFQDGSPAVLRMKIVVTFEAKISRHGLPLLLVATYTQVPTDSVNT